ncbi:MAG: hypothetical protein A2189_05435 [Paenibacillus sp. RIFOXYA1_FULL_44_5]|nr:MAG: hypothetical protein A2189_05435 [Paenibacillus sp. RIFOXYA1_FULL_44_5]
MGAGSIYLAMLLFSLTPLIVFIMSFIMIPVVMLYVKLSKKSFWIYNVIILLLVNVVTYGIGMGAAGTYLTLMSLFFLIPSVVIGHFYKSKTPAKNVVVAGGLVLLGEVVLLLLFISLSGVNVTMDMKEMVQQSMATLPVEVQNAFSKDVMNGFVDTVVKMLPLYMIWFSTYFITVTHWVSRRLLNKRGESIPGLKPIREWKLPGSLIWYYIGAIILDFFFVHNTDSTLYMILINLLPILMFVFSLQAISFFFFLAHVKGRGRGLPITALVLMLIFPPLQQIFALLGMFDIAFPIRERLR